MTARPRLILAVLAVAIAVGWCAVLADAHIHARASVLDRLESSLLDLRVLAFGRRTAPEGVLIAAIDDATVARARGFPIPRGMMAEAVSRLLADGARAVVIDALFLDPGPGEADDALGQALARGPTAIAAMVAYSAEGAAGSGGAAPPDCLLATPPIRKGTSLGLINIALDRSGEARHIPMLLPCRGGVLPGLPLKAAALAGGAEPAFVQDAVTIGGVTTPLDAGRALALRYYGPEATIRTVGLATILDGTAPGNIARGRTVVIGATASGVGDRHATPFDAVLPGVEIMATAVANLETGDALVRTTAVRRADAAVALAMALGAIGCILVDNIGLGLLGLAVLVAAWLAATMACFAQGFWLAMAMPLAAMVPVAGVTAVGRLALDRLAARRQGRLQAALSAFQSPAILARLARDPGFLSEPIERTIAVVFIDLSGFTGLSERLGAQVTRDMLKEWHAIVETGVAAGGGFAASYMADGAMLVWGLAERRADDARAAVLTAMRLHADTLAWLGPLEPLTGRLGVKVGGHLGPAILSRLGHASHQHITAIGDTVNVASRLMEVAAEHGSAMALSATLLSHASAEGLDEAVGPFGPPLDVPIRGRKNPVSIRLWAGHDGVVAGVDEEVT